MIDETRHWRDSGTVVLLFVFKLTKVVKHPSIVSSMTVVYLPSLSEITGMSQNGLIKPEQLTNVHAV